MPIAIESATTLLAVFDVPRSITFYRDALGFEVTNTSKPFTAAKDDYGWAMLRLNGVELMLNNMYENNVRPLEPDQARAAFHADTIIYFACRDVDGAYTALRARGLAASEPRIAYYGMKQTYLTDPDGTNYVFNGRSVRTDSHEAQARKLICVVVVNELRGLLEILILRF